MTFKELIDTQEVDQWLHYSLLSSALIAASSFFTWSTSNNPSSGVAKSFTGLHDPAWFWPGPILFGHGLMTAEIFIPLGLLTAVVPALHLLKKKASNYLWIMNFVLAGFGVFGLVKSWDFTHMINGALRQLGGGAQVGFGFDMGMFGLFGVFLTSLALWSSHRKVTDHGGEIRNSHEKNKSRNFPLRKLLYIFAALVVALLSIFGLSALLNKSGKLNPSNDGGQASISQGTTTTQPQVPLTANEIAAQVTKWLQQSAADRLTVVQAISQLTSCMNISSNYQTLQNALSSRQSLISEIQSQDFSSLTNGPQLQQDFLDAMNASLQADQFYSNWANDLQMNGCSLGSSTQDDNYRSASGPDSQATLNKNSFLSLWNSLAGTYNQPNWTGAF
jgi:hypothetical protein